MGTVTQHGWKNKGGTGTRKCKCGSWKQHWINNSNENWPSTCRVFGCTNTATSGLHIYNPNVSGEFIIPGCQACNNKSKDETFSLNSGITLISANQSKTCKI